MKLLLAIIILIVVVVTGLGLRGDVHAEGGEHSHVQGVVSCKVNQGRTSSDDGGIISRSTEVDGLRSVVQGDALNDLQRVSCKTDRVIQYLTYRLDTKTEEEGRRRRRNYDDLLTVSHSGSTTGSNTGRRNTIGWPRVTTAKGRKIIVSVVRDGITLLQELQMLGSES